MSEKRDTKFVVRLLQVSDIPEFVKILNMVGFHEIKTGVDISMRIDPEGVFIAEDPDSGIISQLNLFLIIQILL